MSHVQRHPGTRARWARVRGEPDTERSIRRITALADLLDSRFVIPGLGVRIGLDPIVGLIPVVGDTATALIGAYIVAEAVRLGTRKRVLARMTTNLALDWAIGLIPIVDIFFDVAFKANNKNARLLIREHEHKRLKQT